MENAQRCPSGLARRFGRRTDHPMTQAALIAELKAREVFDWPALWGIVWSHREACMLAALRALDAALAEPKATKAGLRRRMLAVFAAIAEDGPEAVQGKGCGELQ